MPAFVRNGLSAAYPALNSEKTPSLSAHEQDQNRELSPDQGRPKDRSQEADEAHLLKAFQKGNVEAFGVLVHRYQDRLYTALTRFLDNKEDALDVLQDTFLSAFANAGSFKGNARFYTWVYRIGMNHAIDLHRKKKPRATVSIYQGDQPEYADPRQDGGPHDKMIREEECQLIRKALQILSAEHRMVIVMKEIDDMRYEEIAEVLEVPVGTVRSRLHRARSELKLVIEKLQTESGE